MKKHFTNLKVAMTLLLLCGVCSVWAEDGDETVYSLDCPKSTSNNSYTTYYDVTVNNIAWNAPGNQYQDQGWRIGGKTKATYDRYLYTKTAITDNISSISVSHGNSVTIIVNSFKLDVYSTAELAVKGGTGDISSVTGTYVDNGSTLFNRPANVDWTGRFYRFTYNLTANSTSARYVLLQGITFYKSSSTTPSGPADPTITTTNMSCGVDDIFDVSVMFSSNSDGTIAYSVIGCPDGATASNYELDGADFMTDYAGDYTIKMEQAADDGKFNSGEATATLTVLPKYTLHITQPADGGVLSVKNGETVLTDGCEVTVGTNLTCEVTNIPEGKRFSRFYVNYDNNGEKYKATNPATFDNIPTEEITEATVTVTYQDLKKYTVTFISNSSSWDEADFWENEGLIFPDEPQISGYAFMGWTTSSEVNSDGDGIVYAKEGDAITSTTTYYAVFAVQEGTGEGETKTLTASSSIKEGHTSYGNYNIGDWSGRFMVMNNSNTYFIQLGYNADPSKTANNSHLAAPSSDKPIKSITITTNNGTSSGRTFYLCDSNTLGTASSDDAIYGYGYTSKTNGSVTIDVVGVPTQVYIYPDGTSYIASISVEYAGASYSDFTTSVPYTATISDAGFATLYLEFAAAIPTGVTAYTATYAEKIITLHEIEGGVIPAETAVVLKGVAGDYDFVKTAYTGETLENVLRGTTEESSYEMLQGTETDKYVYTLNQGDNGVGFFHMTNADDSKLAANRAYLLIPVADFEDGAGTIGFRFGDATQIENVNAVEAGKYFDLQGREVLNPAGGIYILNGKKVLVK